MSTLIKSRENPERRRMCMVNGEAPDGRSLKRRRKDLTAAAADVVIASQDQQMELVVDLSSAPTSVRRSSRFRGVSRHRWTGRFEAHLWDKLTWNVTQKKKGKQGNTILLANQ